MRYAPGHKAQTRERILAAASTVFRREGYHASGVDQVMEEAGLTAGGFYAHFDSKESLLAAAIAHSGARSACGLTRGSSVRRGRAARAFPRALFELAALPRAGRRVPAGGLGLGGRRCRRGGEDGLRVARLRYGASAACPRGGSRRRPSRGARARGGCALCRRAGAARSVKNRRRAARILAACRTVAREILCPEGKSPGRARSGRKRKNGPSLPT